MNVKYKVLYIDLESDPVWKKYRLMVRERLLSRMNMGEEQFGCCRKINILNSDTFVDTVRLQRRHLYVEAGSLKRVLDSR